MVEVHSGSDSSSACCPPHTICMVAYLLAEVTDFKTDCPDDSGLSMQPVPTYNLILTTFKPLNAFTIYIPN